MDSLDAIDIAPELLGLIPRMMLLEMAVLPLKQREDSVLVAIADDADPSVTSDLSFLVGKRIDCERYPRAVIMAGIGRHYADIADETTSEAKRPSANSQPETETQITGSATHLADRIIEGAIRMSASDIHVEPYENSLRVRYRLDGVLQEAMTPPSSIRKQLISRLKIMAELDIAEKRRPQDGRIRLKKSDRVIDIRVSTLPTDFGEKVVLRILDKSQLRLDLSRLGFDEQDLAAFSRAIKLPYGIILVTGPTGSGKTTTLYGALNRINSPEINIVTIEDPIEYNLHGINQTHIRADIGLTFAEALRSILRQDPNVIMLGEIRDAETAEIATRAALTGHLVLSTLHTNDAPSAVSRLIDMGVEPFLVAGSLRLVVAQRLLRKLCGDCKKEAETPEEYRSELGAFQAHQFFSSDGCPRCHDSGYSGRTAVYELMSCDESLSELIAGGASASELRRSAKQSGMRTLREAAIQKALRGETSIAEVFRET